ncbi:MAG: hypothetical protein ACUVQZ_08815 [Candidatus Caldatribacteriaceae bacterium]
MSSDPTFKKVMETGKLAVSHIFLSPDSGKQVVRVIGALGSQIPIEDLDRLVGNFLPR